MTFAKVNPSGWALNDELTHAQINQLDGDHANALDKTGDTIPSSAVIECDGGLAFVGSSAYGQWYTGSSLVVNSGAATSFANNPVFTGNPTFSTGTVTFDHGAQFVSGTINISSSANVYLETGAALQTRPGSGSRYQLGDNDYPVYISGHPAVNPKRLVGLASLGITDLTNWKARPDGTSVESVNAGHTLYLQLPCLWTGAVLTSVDVFMIPAPGHSTLPTLPIVNFTSTPVAAGSTTYPAQFSWGTAQYTATSASDWNNQIVRKVTITLSGGGATIDTSATLYQLVIQDEIGTGLLAGNQYIAASLNYALSDMRPQ